MYHKHTRDYKPTDKQLINFYLKMLLFAEFQNDMFLTVGFFETSTDEDQL
jgi:hypothetical protein